MRIVQHALPSYSAGSSRLLRSLHFGAAKSGRKVYIQASLHADEIPAMLVAQHLKKKLEQLEQAGQIAGEIVLVPMANPIGLAQDLQGALFGRFELGTGVNFNRNFKHLTPALIDKLEGKLGQDAEANTRLIRQTCRTLLEDWLPQTEAESLKRLLQSLSVDADIVLDLHCDHQAVPHIYACTQQADAVMPLTAYLGAQAMLLAKVSGGDPFDESNSRIWWELAEHFNGRFPIQDACISVTVELRGEVDVEHGLAQQDAQAMIEYLRQAGHIGGELLSQPAPRCAATPLEGVEPIAAPHSGLIVYFKAPGDMVAVGEAIGEVIDPFTDQTTPLRSTVAGLLYARISRRYATRGMRVAKVAGTQPFRSGKLLSM